MAGQNTEGRVSALEQDVADLKQQLQQALTERRPFDKLRLDVRELRVRYQAHEEYVAERFNDVEADVSVLIDAAKEHRAAIEQLQVSAQALQAGQDQILAILTGRAKTND